MTKIPIRTLPLLALLSACLLLIFLTQSREKNPVLSVLDVGQGDAELYTTGGEVMLVDTGPTGSIRTKLRSSGIKHRIDLLVLTHSDADHIGGMQAILDSYDVGAVITNGVEGEEGSMWAKYEAYAREKGTAVISLRRGDSIYVGTTKLKVLHPNEEFRAGAGTNEASLVLLLDAPGLKVLLSGDAGIAAEESMLSLLSGVDVLKVGHHGSKSATGENFLERIRPLSAIISVGADNSYGHPNPEVTKRLEKFGIPVYRTDQSGTITIKPAPNGFSVSTEKE